MRTSLLVLTTAALAAGCAGEGEVMMRDQSGADASVGNAVGDGAGSYAVPPPAPEVSEAFGSRGRAASAPAAVTVTGAPTGSMKELESLRLQQVASSSPGQQAVAPSMIIRTGFATVEVDSLEPAIQSVQALALSIGGYVANIGMQTGRTQLRQATLELKVPADRFDQAVEGLSPMGRLESMNVTAEDVGEEFTDVTARVTNAQRLEERLLALLATRTGRLEDILAAERELARVRQEIERYEGRLRYLRSRIAMSTLHVTVHEPSPIIARAGRNPIVEAFRGAWRNFVGLVAALIELMGILIPLGALAAVVVAAWLRWGPRWTGRSATGGAGASG